ncbi:hypothetical protein E2320_003069 [Naja naja]
MEKAS